MADAPEDGTLVITYTADGREYESGGWTAADLEWLLPALEKDGCVITGQRDGIEWAREEFPPGARVCADGKYWKSPLGTVTGEYRLSYGTGRQVRVRFDDGWTSEWTARRLSVIAPAGQHERIPEAAPSPADPGPCPACRKPLAGHQRGIDGVTCICPVIGPGGRAREPEGRRG